MDAQSLKKQIAQFLKVKEERIQDSTVLTSLVMESFVLVEMVMFLQDEFEVRIIQDDLKDVQTVGDLIKVFQSKATH